MMHSQAGHLALLLFCLGALAAPHDEVSRESAKRGRSGNSSPSGRSSSSLTSQGSAFDDDQIAAHGVPTPQQFPSLVPEQQPSGSGAQNSEEGVESDYHVPSSEQANWTPEQRLQYRRNELEILRQQLARNQQQTIGRVNQIQDNIRRMNSNRLRMGITWPQTMREPEPPEGHIHGDKDWHENRLRETVRRGSLSASTEPKVSDAETAILEQRAHSLNSQEAWKAYQQHLTSLLAAGKAREAAIRHHYNQYLRRLDWHDYHATSEQDRRRAYVTELVHRHDLATGPEQQQLHRQITRFLAEYRRQHPEPDHYLDYITARFRS